VALGRALHPQTPYQGSLGPPPSLGSGG
jgi:hypothetical protein